MNISIFGTGYVGLVTGACLAEVGHDVYCVDVDKDKIDLLSSGQIPIYEPGLQDLVQSNLLAQRIHFSTDTEEAIKHAEVLMLTVGTPTDEDGSADLQHIITVAKTIAETMEDEKIIVTKSTVPVGTSYLVKQIIEETLISEEKRLDFLVASNPEFLKEGDAVNDFLKPDRIVLGCDDEYTEHVLKSIYAPFNRSHDRCIVMDIKSAELTKYASNAMLATKISFMNELSQIAERVDADIEQVRDGIGADSRIGYSFIYPGIGFGGSCFPKDIRALSQSAKAQGYNPKILNAVEAVNEAQKKALIDKILFHFNGNIKDHVFGLWGLSFKPKTDDMREAPSRVIIETLCKLGAKIKAYDPVAMEAAKNIYTKEPNFSLCKTRDEALEGSYALIIATEWKTFWSPDFSAMKQLLKSPVIFDGRNLYDPSELEQLGFTYYAIGRGKKIHA